MTFKIGLFEEVHKNIKIKSDAMRITNILLRYDRRKGKNWTEIYEELYFYLRSIHWGPTDCDGLARYWLKMMDDQPN